MYRLNWAVIQKTNVYPDGDTVSLKMSGLKMESQIAEIMRDAKDSGDISKFTNIKIQIDRGRAVIQAIRFAVLQNYSDVLYKMVVEAGQDGSIRITEENLRIYP